MVNILSRCPMWLLPLPALLTLVAVLYLNLSLLGVPAGVALGVAGVVTAGLLGWLIVWRERLGQWLERLLRPVEQIESRRWLLLVLAIGLLLRLGWALIFNAPPRSDFAIYFDLARGLVERGAYGGNGSYQAYWPPGLPLFLAPFLAIGGPPHWVPLLANLFLTTLTIILTAGLPNPRAGRVAPLLVAIWPSNVMSAGLASKEQLLLPLVTALVLTFVRGLSGGRSWHLLLTGGLIGCATLTQPSFILLPAVLGLAEVAATGSLRVPLRHGLVVVFGVALVLAPWIWRNYRIFGELVMVSTNGGDVLYRANNPLATGTYTERGEVDLQGMAELERNRRGGELAREWIRNHPRQFLHLAFRKQIAFLGDDNMGAYETLRRGLGIGGPTLHLAKLVSTGYWMLIWMLILLGWLRAPTLYQLPLFSIPLLIVICQLVIDSVYESGSRHHVPLSGLLAILAAVPFGGSLRR
ncbi:MAG: hypothetical protein RIR86_2661 [Acidobacteriota bacterium]|jgi:4-amino-4-deoxy-L-arabinose transferase-like glycosyltransferase